MNQPYEEEIAANLERADKSLEAAKQLASAGHYDFAVSRAYYAAFYAATAALLDEGREFKRHSGVIAAIHQHFIACRVVHAAEEPDIFPQA